MTDCIFCKILAGDSPASQVYRDERVAAFMDIQPVTPGHTLVIPIQHSVYLSDLEAEDGAQIFRVGQRISQALFNSSVRCEGINFFVANGAVAGQDVFHFHMHIIPRFKGDGFGLRFPPTYTNSRPSRLELDAIALQIRSALPK